MAKTYSLPLDQTALYIHFVEVRVRFEGYDPEPEDEDEAEEDRDSWFYREYCYIVPDCEDPNLRETVFDWVPEDDPEWEVDEIEIINTQKDHISDYPTNCTMMDKDKEAIFKEEFVRRWGEPRKPSDAVTIKEDRLYVQDLDHVLFPVGFFLGRDKMSNEELIEHFEDEDIEGLQIHEDGA